MALGEAGDSGFGELPLFDAGHAPAPEMLDIDLTALPHGAGAPTGSVDLPLPESLPEDLEGWLDAQERRVLVRALDETGFNRTAAAARLGLNLRQMRYRMSRLGITEPGSDDPGHGDH